VFNTTLNNTCISALIGFAGEEKAGNSSSHRQTVTHKVKSKRIGYICAAVNPTITI
jgi:hypothetical protein